MKRTNKCTEVRPMYLAPVAIIPFNSPKFTSVVTSSTHGGVSSKQPCREVFSVQFLVKIV